MGQHQPKIGHDAARPHHHHGLAGVFEGEHKGDQQPRHQRRPPHDGDGVGAEHPGNDAAVLEVGDHPAGDAGLGGVLAEDQPHQQPEPGAAQEAPVDLPAGLFAAPLHRGDGKGQPQGRAHQRQQEQRRFLSGAAGRRNGKGAQQCPAGITAVHQVHAAGAVGAAVPHQDGAGVDDLAFGRAHQEKAQPQQGHHAGKAHQAVAHQVTQAQKQDAALHPAQQAGQHPGQKARRQVADVHQAEQGAGDAVGKAVLLLQQADHHPAGNGADAAEEKGCKARVPAAGQDLLFVHGVPPHEKAPARTGSAGLPAGAFVCSGPGRFRPGSSLTHSFSAGR